MKLMMCVAIAVAVAVGAGAGASCRCTPPATVDEPAGNLEVKAAFIDVDESPSDGKQPVIVQLFRGGAFVQLAGTAMVEANGVPLTWNGIGYAERVPLVPPGGAYTISHRRGATVTRMNVTVPPRPVITTPAAGATVARSPTFVITYPPGGGTSVRPGVAGPATSRSGAAQPDDGTATIDASDVGTGPGSVSLVRDVEGTVSGTGFAAARFVYTTGKRQPVVWQ
jgi:hypothetical protein